MPKETASLGRQRRAPRQGRVRGRVPPSVPFLGLVLEQQPELRVQAGRRSTSPRASRRAGERRPRGPGRPFCACAARLAPPPAWQTRLPPNLNASSAGRAGLRRPTDLAGLPTRSSGRRAARATGLQPRDVAFSLKPSTFRDPAAVRVRMGVPRGLPSPPPPHRGCRTVTPLSPPLCTL